MKFKSPFFPILTLALFLSGTAMPMEKQTGTIAHIMKSAKESSCYNWIEQNKVPILIGTCAALTAGILYTYFWKKPTTAQIKAQIRKETQPYLIHCAQTIRNGIEVPNAGKVRISVPPSNTDYVMIINKIIHNNSIAGINATYTYACDNSTQNVQILYE